MPVLDQLSPLFSRNVMNILLYVAEASRFYFPPSETPKMLEEFIPLVTQDVSHTLQEGASRNSMSLH